MTRMPGRFLLKVARFVFDDSVRTAVVTPTISDLQEEVRAAGGNRMLRAIAAMRGYAAFWLLVIAAPVAFHRWPTRSIGAPESADRNPGAAFGLIVAAVVLCSWNFLGSWTLVVAGGGLVFAYVMHRWNDRHPIVLAVPEKNVWHAPQINMSRITIDGNIAGLMYVVGSLVVAMLGLPIVRLFFFTTVVLGVLCAASLVAWHSAHPRRRMSVLA